MCCAALFSQIGGSDQWGNITAGTDLARKLIGKEGEEPEEQNGNEEASTPSTSQTCYGLTFPLLVRWRVHAWECDGACLHAWLTCQSARTRVCAFVFANVFY